MRTAAKENKAQIVGEYVVTIAVVVSVLTAMTVFVRRVLQARMYDSETVMLQTVNRGSRVASGGAIEIRNEYEPYYGDSRTDVTQDVDENVSLLPGGRTGIFNKSVNSQSESHTTSVQLPPSQSR